MSYNINTVHYLDYAGSDYRLSITAEKVTALRDHFWASGVYLPEDNFLQDPETHELFKGGVIQAPNWCGEFSGNTYDSFLYALTKTTGEAAIVLCWEGGDSFTGLLIKDGVVTEHEIIHQLGAEVPQS